MNLTQILAWLTGPSVASALSWLAEQWTPWVKWDPKTILGFDPKAAITGIVTLGVGFGAYELATNIPASTISTVDPYVAAAFPLLAFLASQVWHAVINKRLNQSTISVTTQPVGTLTADVKATVPPTK